MTDLTEKTKSPPNALLTMLFVFVVLTCLLTMRDGTQALFNAAPWLTWLLGGMAILAVGGYKQSSKLIILGLIMILWVGWENTFYEMWLRWYPHWKYETRSLSRRLMGGSSYYSHGPLVPLTSLFVVWFIYKRVGVPVSRTRVSKFLGASMIIFFTLTQLLSIHAGIMFASGFSLVGLIGGIIVYTGGKNLAKAYWMPVTLLLFMVPWPEEWIYQLNFSLKNFASTKAVWLTRQFGISIFQPENSSYLYFQPDPVTGAPKMLIVEDVCSGLRSLISLFWFGALFAVVCKSRGFWRLVIFSLSFPVAVGCNIVRITILNITADKMSVKDATEGGVVHDLSGFIVFALALGVLFLFENIIILIGKLLKRNWCDERLLGFLSEIPKNSKQKTTRSFPIVWVSIVLIAVFTIFTNQLDDTVFTGDYSRNAVPETIFISGMKHTRVMVEVDQQSKDILETDDCVIHVYHPADGGKKIDLLIVYSQNNRKATHPPEQCLEGGAGSIRKKDYINVDVVSAGKTTTYRMRELITQHAGRETLFLYVFKTSDTYTPSFSKQQFHIILNGLISSNTSGSLVRFSIDVTDNDVEKSRKQLVSTIQSLLPIIDQNLP